MGSIDSGLYRGITDFAHDTPSWFQHLMEVWTELGLLLFAVLFVVAWWRARRGDPRAFAVAVLAPLATAVAYVCSELIKSGLDEERPCRAVAHALPSLVECPAYGDWSFPSNHSTIAAAAAVGLALAWPRIGRLTIPMALLMAFSRVFVGVHYPHDVAVGLLLGTLVTLLVVGLLRGPGARVTDALRGSGNGLARWFAGAGRSVGSVPGAEWGPVRGAESGSAPGAEWGPVPGAESGSAPGAEWGPVPGAESGSAPGAEWGPVPGSAPGSASAYRGRSRGGAHRR